MKLTEALRGEHGVIYALFDHLRETILTSNDFPEVKAAVAVVDRLLLSHARIEEDFLFPRLDPFLGDMGPLTVMRAEHREIDQLLATAKQQTDLNGLKSVISQLLNLALGHFQKEEMALFPMAEQCLDDAALSAMADEWAARRKVNIIAEGCMGMAS